MRAPSGEMRPWKARGSAIAVSTPPDAGTVQNLGAALGAHVARADANTTAAPSGVPALHGVATGMPREAQLGSPPVAATT